MLEEAALFLAAAVLFVPLLKRARLGAVLGYLAAGLVIGPHGLGLASDAESVLNISEFGVILLLFVIGLELQPSRLWRLRREVFGFGGAQVGLTTVLFACVGWALQWPWSTALAVGFALSMSSTALVLQLLGERHELVTQHGRMAFAVLLFQDIAVIPFMALLPLLTPHAGHAIHWFKVIQAVVAVAAVIFIGRTLLRPALRTLAATDVPEVFTAAALLLVISVSLLMQTVGLSASLGAFLAGVLLADSEYRHELQADLDPFKGLLLGLFFIAVGMSARLELLVQQPLQVAAFTLGILLLKAAVLYALARAGRLSSLSALSLGAALSQGGEFAFVLFGVVGAAGLLDESLRELLTVSVTLSMITTAPLYAGFSAWRRLRGHDDAPPPFDEIRTAETPVIIAGFGPFGQIIGRILRLKRIAYTVLDKNAQHVDFVRGFGNPVYYSDASRAEVLRAAHVARARLFVVAIADETENLAVVEAVRKHAPAVRLMAVARNRQHAIKLMAFGIKSEDLIRRSYYSSLEMTRRVLVALDHSPAAAASSVALFQSKDEDYLLQQQAVALDEQALRQTVARYSKELEDLFAADTAADAAADTAASDAKSNAKSDASEPR